MRGSRWLAAALVAGVVISGMGARPARAEEQPTGIHVRGQGTVSVAPDIAVLELGASVRREKALDAYQRAEQLVANLTAALQANGVAERDIQTRQFSINPEYGTSRESGPPPIVGWRAVHTVRAKIRDLTHVGETVDAAVRSLESEIVVQGLSFTIEDTDALAAQARAAAVADARAKAEDYAARAGVRVGRIVSLQEVSAPAPTPTANLALPVAAGAADLASRAQISPGQQDITVIVEIVYAID